MDQLPFGATQHAAGEHGANTFIALQDRLIEIFLTIPVEGRTFWWAGFLSSVTGAMRGSLGNEDMLMVMRSTMDFAEAVVRLEPKL